MGSTTVREYLAEKRREAAELFIRLVHRPGEEAQVDFFEVTVEEKGVRKSVWKFVMRLMHAGWDFVWLYDRCDEVSFLDRHVRALQYFGGVCRRCIYDNLTLAAPTDSLNLSMREWRSAQSYVSVGLTPPARSSP